MGEDRSIPDHVNDGVPEDEVARVERYHAALGALATRGGDGDAIRMIEDCSRIGDMKRTAFINAAINNVPAITAKLRASFPGIVDLPALVKRVRLEAIMRRLDGL